MLEIIILGIIQGIAEFLPISSSAHLIIFRDVFGIGVNILENMELTFDVALHFGTLLAILVFFFKDFFNMIKDGLTKGTKTKSGKIFWYIVIATIPAALIGVLFEDVVEKFFRTNIWLIAIALVVMGVIIYLVDKKSQSNKTIEKITLKDALLIGVSQVFALIPGFSRSGTTITTGRLLKLNKEDSAKFSFYLSAPIVFGATVFSLMKDNTLDLVLANLNIFVIGVLVAFITGLLCINFLLKYIKKNDFKLFMIYRIILAIVVIGFLLF